MVVAPIRDVADESATDTPIIVTKLAPVVAVFIRTVELTRTIWVEMAFVRDIPRTAATVTPTTAALERVLSVSLGPRFKITAELLTQVPACCDVRATLTRAELGPFDPENPAPISEIETAPLEGAFIRDPEAAMPRTMDASAEKTKVNVPISCCAAGIPPPPPAAAAVRLIRWFPPTRLGSLQRTEEDEIHNAASQRDIPPPLAELRPPPILALVVREETPFPKSEPCTVILAPEVDGPLREVTDEMMIVSIVIAFVTVEMVETINSVVCCRSWNTCAPAAVIDKRRERLNPEGSLHSADESDLQVVASPVEPPTRTANDGAESEPSRP